MPKLNIQRPHTVGLETAKGHVRSMVEDVQSQFPSLVHSVQWSNDGTSASFNGKMVSGDFRVDDRQVAVALNLSFLASPFLSKIEGQIHSALDQRFGGV